MPPACGCRCSRRYFHSSHRWRRCGVCRTRSAYSRYGPYKMLLREYQSRCGRLMSEDLKILTVCSETSSGASERHSCDRRPRKRHSSEADHRIRRDAAASGHLDITSLRRRWRVNVVRAESRRQHRPRRHLRRSNSRRRQAGRPSGRTADQVRVGDQSEDRQGPRPHGPAIAVAAGGSAYRVDRRAYLIWSGPFKPAARSSPRGWPPSLRSTAPL
jgi:hypothetical protein